MSSAADVLGFALVAAMTAAMFWAGFSLLLEGTRRRQIATTAKGVVMLWAGGYVFADLTVWWDFF